MRFCIFEGDQSKEACENKNNIRENITKVVNSQECSIVGEVMIFIILNDGISQHDGDKSCEYNSENDIYFNFVSHRLIFYK